MLPPYYLLFNVDIYNRELWYLTSLSTIFKLYRGGQFFWVEETGVPNVKFDIRFCPKKKQCRGCDLMLGGYFFL
jgi:hypothetical protein